MPQRTGAPARQVDLVARDAVARTHRAGVELAAMAVVVAHLDGLGEAMRGIAAGSRWTECARAWIVLHVPRRPVERRREFERLIARREAEESCVIHSRWMNDLA